VAAMTMPNWVRIARMKAEEEKTRAAEQARAAAPARDRERPDPAPTELAPRAQQAQSAPAAEGAGRPVVAGRQSGGARAEEDTGAVQPIGGERTRRDTEPARVTARRTVKHERRSGPGTSPRNSLPDPDRHPARPSGKPRPRHEGRGPRGRP